MKVRCRIELNYSSIADAEKVLKAVAVDNEGFLTARQDGRTIVSDLSSDSILGLVHTVEDYLACVSIAEKAIKEAGARRHARGPRPPSRRRASRRGS